jgi:spermidine/putrescine transport system permease protein
MVARVPRWVLGVSLMVYAFLHVPILVLVVFSFNDSKFSVDWAGFTTACWSARTSSGA